LSEIPTPPAKTELVRGHFRKDGKWVAPYWRVPSERTQDARAKR